MEIHYLWIYQSGHLKKAGVNLSARFVIDMLKDEGDTEKYTLVIQNNPDYIPNFFGKKNICNITAIIGKNGAGKSSILNYIREHLPEGLEGSIENDLFVYSVGENDKEEFYILKPVTITVSVDNRTGIDFKPKQYGDDIASLQLNGHLGKAEYIYYSYLLHFNEDPQPWHGLTNLSSAYLMLEERRSILEENRGNIEELLPLQQNSDLDRFYVSEVHRAIQFLSGDVVQLPFPKPENLRIELDFSDIAFFKSPSADPSILQLINECQAGIATGSDLAGKFMQNLRLAILVNYLIDQKKYSSDSPYTHFPQRNEGESVQDYLVRYFQSMENVSIPIGNNKTARVSKLESLFQDVPAIVDLIRDLIWQSQATVIDETTLGFNLNSQTDEFFKRFSKLYLRIKGISAFLKFKWRSLSSGEQSYLSLLSRFYHAARHQHNQLPSNLVILIDEGDIGFHPEWQRKFLKTLLDFLSSLFEKHTLQIIFTANTPFLTSDLPKSHVLFIEKGDGGISLYHSKSNDREDTFGSNIHTLFSNSFYMDGVLMGEFAKAKINEIIGYLTRPKKKNEVPDENYRKIIDQIGELALKKKLQDMWIERFEIHDEIKMLERRLEHLKELEKKKTIIRKKQKKTNKP
ncbi:MAG: AAA family ATPase [Puia sp.]|nr:AAA family ATPase [Puia sp.]